MQIIIIIIIIRYLYSASLQVAVQLRNCAANALKQLRDIEQISFQF